MLNKCSLFHLYFSYWDEYETETLFLNDLDKAYNESDSEMDPDEREEEMQRMREKMMSGTYIYLV